MLCYVLDRLRAFYTPEEARVWWQAPHPMLKGERAIGLINAGRSDEVVAVIESLEAGAFT